MVDVLIIYSSKDANTVMQLAKSLRDLKIEVGFNVTGLAGETSIIEKIAINIQRASNYLIIISDNTAELPHFATELALALSVAGSSKNRRIIPLLLSSRVSMPFFLKHLHWLTLSDPPDYREASQEIAHALRSELNFYIPRADTEIVLDQNIARIISKTRILDLLKTSNANNEKIEDRFSNIFALLWILTIMVVPFTLALIGDKAWTTTLAILSPALTVMAFIAGRLSKKGGRHG